MIPLGVVGGSRYEQPLVNFEGFTVAWTGDNGSSPIAITLPEAPSRVLFIAVDMNDASADPTLVSVNGIPTTAINNQTSVSYRKISWIIQEFPVGDTVEVDIEKRGGSTIAVWSGYDVEVVGAPVTDGVRSSNTAHFAVSLPVGTEAAIAMATSRQNHYVEYGGWTWSGADLLAYPGENYGSTDYRTTSWAQTLDPGEEISVSCPASGQGRGLTVLPLRRRTS